VTAVTEHAAEDSKSEAMCDASKGKKWVSYLFL